MSTDAPWTIDELTRLVGQALAVDYAGQVNGRVREVPDRRTIRWYTTIGLLDRPAEMRGRTAFYGRRHLMQLVAVKRLQAGGSSIADAQVVLLGADDTTLAELARLPDHVGQVDAEPARVPVPDRSRFWSAAAVPASGSTSSVDDGMKGMSRPVLVPAIRLGGGVRLLLADASRRLADEDLDAIGEAAIALLEVLRERGLSNDHPDPDESAPPTPQRANRADGRSR